MKAFRLLTAAVALLCASTTYAQARQNGFSVILLVGDNQPAAGGDSLPPAPGVRKALGDVKDFLPYKSYHVLDTQWMRSGSTRMKGADDQEYEVELSGDEMPVVAPFNTRPGMLDVRFRLTEAGAALMPGEEFSRAAQAAELEKQLATLRTQMPNATGSTLQEQKARIERVEKQIRLMRARKLIESKFNMTIGETVVVGTSKIGGDKGLVVLLTSVAAK